MNADQAKAAAEMVVTMWESEIPVTASVIAAVKDENRTYKPDPKSRSAWDLAVHLATADVWLLDSIVKGAFIWDEDRVKQTESRFRSINDIVEFYRKALPETISAFRALPAERMLDTLDFFGVMKMSRAQLVLFANNHSVHHRGQLASYLRAMGSRVPTIYGPSADAEPATA
jgi:uncharacterized damage-inducible protein DinB